MRTILSIVLAMLWLTLPLHAQTDDNALAIGATLPTADAQLYDVQRNAATTASALMGNRATAFIFWSNQCPWVDRYQDRVKALHQQFSDQGVRIVLVNPNDANTFEKENRTSSAARASDQGYGGMRYVRDDTGAFARGLGAIRTPHVFLFDADRTLVYRGTIDNSPGNASDVTRPFLRAAIEATVQGQAVSESETNSFGCMIKLPR